MNTDNSHNNYASRYNYYSQYTHYSLKEKCLDVVSEKHNCSVPYDSIQTVRLLYDPVKLLANRFSCQVKNHQHKFILSSANFIGLGSFEDRSLSYVAFITHFHEKIKAQKNIRYISGITQFLYLFSIILTLFSGITILTLIIYFSEIIMSLYFILKLSVLFLSLLLFSYFIKVNKPSTYNGAKLPKHLLPDIKPE